MTDYTPWKGDKLDDSLKQTRKTEDVSEGMSAIRGVREKMGNVLKKDQALKVSMYVPTQTKREEGETWEEDGKLWEMKNGIKQSISKLQAAKRPWWCPECGMSMSSRLDDKMWYKKRKCYDCVVKEETQMRLDGTWDAYQRKMLRANVISMLKDKIEELTDYRDIEGNPQIHFQDGRYEEWKIDNTQLKADLQEEIDKLQKDVEELERMSNES